MRGGWLLEINKRLPDLGLRSKSRLCDSGLSHQWLSPWPRLVDSLSRTRPMYSHDRLIIISVCTPLIGARNSWTFTSKFPHGQLVGRTPRWHWAACTCNLPTRRELAGCNGRQTCACLLIRVSDIQRGSGIACVVSNTLSSSSWRQSSHLS